MSYQDEVFLHDCEIMQSFGRAVAKDPMFSAVRKQSAIAMLANAIADVHKEREAPLTYVDLSHGFETYFGQGIDAEYLERTGEERK